MKLSTPTKLAITVIVLGPLLSSCKKEDPTPNGPANEEEVITTFVFKIAMQPPAQLAGTFLKTLMEMEAQCLFMV